MAGADHPISTGPLATVQPAVRNPEQTFGFPAVIWPLGNPEGGGYPDTGITIGQIAFSNPLAQLIHQDKRIRRLHIPQNQAELLATEAADEVRASQALGQASADVFENIVSGLVAQGVVHKLEVVNVHDHESKTGSAAITLGDGPIQCALEIAAIGEARQRISLGHIHQALLGLFAAPLIQVNERQHQGTAQHHVEQIDHRVGAADLAKVDVVDNAADDHEGRAENHAFFLAEQQVGKNRHHQHPDESGHRGFWQQHYHEEKCEQRHQIGINPLLQVGRGFQAPDAEKQQRAGTEFTNAHPEETIENLQACENHQCRAGDQKKQPHQGAAMAVAQT